MHVHSDKFPSEPYHQPIVVCLMFMFASNHAVRIKSLERNSPQMINRTFYLPSPGARDCCVRFLVGYSICEKFLPPLKKPGGKCGFACCCVKDFH